MFQNVLWTISTPCFKVYYYLRTDDEIWYIIEEGQTTQWAKERGQNTIDDQQNITYKTKEY
jgi:hypothetical protein